MGQQGFKMIQLFLEQLR